MKKIHKRILKPLQLLLAIGALLGPALVPLPALAAGTSFSMVANKATVSNGSTLIVAMYMNGGGVPINALQLDFSYPASKLQYVGFSAGGSPFDIGASSGGGDGSGTIARGTTSPVSGSGLIGTVTFKALASSGSASIGVLGSSNLISANDNSAVPYASYGASVNFGTVASAPAPAASAAKPAANAPPPPPKDTTPPTISAVAIKDLSPFKATITWTTSEPADSVVEYGLDASYGLSAGVNTQDTKHAVPLSSAFLTPQTVLHYRVKSTDGAGNAQVSADQTLALPGVPVTVVVHGSDGKPQAGALVTLDNKTVSTNAHGEAAFRTGLGNKQIVTNVNGLTAQRNITVAKTEKPLPPYQLSMAKQPADRWMMISVILGVAVLLLLIIDAILFGSRLFNRILLQVSTLRAPKTAPVHAGFASDFGPLPQPTVNTASTDVRYPFEDNPEPAKTVQVPVTSETFNPFPEPEAKLSSPKIIKLRKPAKKKI